MTAIEAALAFAEADFMDYEGYRKAVTALIPHIANKVPREHTYETALRILAAQVRADAAKRLELSMKVSQMPPEFEQMIDDNFWDLIAK